MNGQNSLDTQYRKNNKENDNEKSFEGSSVEDGGQGRLNIYKLYFYFSCMVCIQMNDDGMLLYFLYTILQQKILV